jgi:hypothetical protein
MCPCLVDKNPSASKEATFFHLLLALILWLLGYDSSGIFKFLLENFCDFHWIGFFFCAALKFLSIDKASVKPILHVKKLFVCTFLDIDTIPENQNAIGTPNGGQPVCNHNCGAIFGNPIKGCLDYLLSTDIDCASSFIQNQNGRLLHDASGYGQTLPLTATQFGAVLSHKCVVPLRRVR